MDIQRKPPRLSRRRVLILGIVAVATVLTVGLALRGVPAASPAIDRSGLWIDVVKRASMSRQVRGMGTLQPEHFRLVSAVTAGRVESLATAPGAVVAPNTVLLELTNPDIQLQALDAERQLTAASSELVAYRANVDGQLITLQRELAEATRASEVALALARERMMSAIEAESAKDRVSELQMRSNLLKASETRQIALSEANISRLREIVRFHSNRIASMHVTAGENGVIQEMNLQLGQWVVPGQLLAKVSGPGKLKAVIRVPEAQARDILVGSRTTVDTRNGVVRGRVVRIDPQAQNGTVTVEAELEEIPLGARAESSVDAVIQIDELSNILQIRRPPGADPGATVSLFRLTTDGSRAQRLLVRLGRASIGAIEVLSGLHAGDRVIVSDTSPWEASEWVRIR